MFHPKKSMNKTTMVLTRKNDPPPGTHVFQPTGTIFELVQDIIDTNLFTKLHDNRTINVASRVLTRKNAPTPWRPYNIRKNLLTKKNAPPLGSHVFQANVNIFETINVASRVLTRQMLTPHNGRQTKGDHKSSP
ncbi:hypothetical protein DPMN_086263 [Dreissena polymorpha]|uniref:Uncharacterized protein n=1 Tax=Dreissena polymorpha TaxID=45954 RepID=A0A9D3YGI6_DREPO|nr:hypothetical protein DPMN_086263 [Dreissena polymorpha]